MLKIQTLQAIQKNRQQGAKRAPGHVLRPALTGSGFATFSICRPGNRIKAEAYFVTGEGLNFLQQRSELGFFNCLVSAGLSGGLPEHHHQAASIDGIN